MEQTGFKVYGYRWIVLLAFMLVIAANQILWITFAPITGSAALDGSFSSRELAVLLLPAKWL